MRVLLVLFLSLAAWVPAAIAQNLEFHADATARFDNPSGGEWQRVFDYGNGPQNNNVWLGQEYNTTNMMFEVWNNGVSRRIVAPNAIVAGQTATWTTAITATGFMTIRKNGVIVAQGQGFTPLPPNGGGTLLVGRSHWGGDTPLIGTATMNAFDLDPQPINCPLGFDGFASSGSGGFPNEIFWLRWDCGSRTVLPAGYVVNKQWIDVDGITVTAQITNLTQDMLVYNTNASIGEQLAISYSGVNPIGLINRFVSRDPQFDIALSTNLNGQIVPMRYIAAEAQNLGGATIDEALIVTTDGSAWTLLESIGQITVSLSGQTATLSDPPGSAPGTALVSTTGSSISLATTIRSGSNARTAAAFGVRMPFDHSDAPLAGTSYGAASHRTTAGGFGIGGGVTFEAAPFDSPMADGDADDGVSWPALLRAQQITVIVPVQGQGGLALWIDYNGDGDFADPGEHVAMDVADGGEGDLDGATNGSISLAVTPPADAVTAPTFARLRFAAAFGAPSAGEYGFGEVEDYRITIINPSLSVTKSSLILSDGVSATNPKAIPGATVRYCIVVTNDGSAQADDIVISDAVPAHMTFEDGTARTGTDCATAAGVTGVSVVNSVITAVIDTLAVGASAALTFNARID